MTWDGLNISKSIDNLLVGWHEVEAFNGEQFNTWYNAYYLSICVAYKLDHGVTCLQCNKMFIIVKFTFHLVCVCNQHGFE